MDPRSTRKTDPELPCGRAPRPGGPRSGGGIGSTAGGSRGHPRHRHPYAAHGWTGVDPESAGAAPPTEGPHCQRIRGLRIRPDRHRTGRERLPRQARTRGRPPSGSGEGSRRPRPESAGGPRGSGRGAGVPVPPPQDGLYPTGRRRPQAVHPAPGTREGRGGRARTGCLRPDRRPVLRAGLPRLRGLLQPRTAHLRCGGDRRAGPPAAEGPLPRAGARVHPGRCRLDGSREWRERGWTSASTRAPAACWTRTC